MWVEGVKLIAGTLVALVVGGCQADKSVPPNQVPTAATNARPSPTQERPTKYDGPFGLKMGLSVETAKNLIPSLSESDSEPGVYNAVSVPVPHPDFESYSLFFSKKSGLCRVVGIGKDIPSGDVGFEVRSAFDALDEALTQKYGKGKKYDFTSEHYESPEYWMLSLLKKNRILAKVWSKGEGLVSTSKCNA